MEGPEEKILALGLLTDRCEDPRRPPLLGEKLAAVGDGRIGVMELAGKEHLGTAPLRDRAEAALRAGEALPLALPHPTPPSLDREAAWPGEFRVRRSPR